MNGSAVKYYFILTLIPVALGLFSCESNFREVQKMGLSEFAPSGDADSFNLKYTDSGKIKANLKASKMLDYATVAYPFTEFPQGIDLTLFDDAGKKTYIKSNYAISYKGTEIIDLQKQVKIYNDSGEMLETEQLYYDQKNEWFFTERKFKFTSSKGISYGEGIDFSKDFKKVNSQRVSGQIQSE
jgi:LPS export ABC transporter protein LptC